MIAYNVMLCPYCHSAMHISGEQTETTRYGYYRCPVCGYSVSDYSTYSVVPDLDPEQEKEAKKRKHKHHWRKSDRVHMPKWERQK